MLKPTKHPMALAYGTKQKLELTKTNEISNNIVLRSRVSQKHYFPKCATSIAIVARVWVVPPFGGVSSVRKRFFASAAQGNHARLGLGRIHCLGGIRI